MTFLTTSHGAGLTYDVRVSKATPFSIDRSVKTSKSVKKCQISSWVLTGATVVSKSVISRLRYLESTICVMEKCQFRHSGFSKTRNVSILDIFLKYQKLVKVLGKTWGLANSRKHQKNMKNQWKYDLTVASMDLTVASMDLTVAKSDSFAKIQTFC